MSKKRRAKHQVPREEARIDLPRHATGIPGFDAILGGGLIPRRLYLVKGPPGSGKTVFASQICFHRAHEGDRCVYVTMLSESNATLLENLSTLEFFDRSLVSRQVTLVNGYRALDEGGLPALSKLLRSTVQKTGARLLVLDGLAAWSDRITSPIDVRRFVRDLATSCSLLACTAVCTMPGDGGTGGWEAHAENVADGLIELSRLGVGLRTARTVEVYKLRGSTHLSGKHIFDITTAGIVVYPRTEARLTRSPAAHETRGRMPFGIEELDDMLHGGVMAASTTAIMGAPGAGKTLLGLQFLAEGARRGERGLYFGFYETPARLVAKAEGVGLPFGSIVQRGVVEVLWRPALEYSLDALAGGLLEAVQQRRVQRLFLDGVNGFKVAALFPERLTRFLTALTNELRALGVATLLSEETQLIGEPAPLRPENLSGIFENLLMLRYLEVRSQLHRLLSVVKMRESDYDSSVREFYITSEGIELEPTFESAEAVLAGTASPPAPHARVPRRSPKRRRSPR